MSRLAVAAVVVGLSVMQSAAQEPAPVKGDLSAETRLVMVPTVVRDKHGALVQGLKKEDFALQVDNKAQVVRYFDHDSDVPLTVGLLVDTSMSQRSVLDEERTASGAFVETMLAPGRDKAFLIQFAHNVDLLQDVTGSRPKLEEALKQVDSERPSFNQQDNGGNQQDNGGNRQDSGTDRQGGGRGGRGGSGSGGTALYDAVFLAADEVEAKQPGRRALIVLTDGDDRGSKETLERAVEAAQRANTIVYAIYYKGEHPGGGFGGPGGGGHRHGGGFPLANFQGQRGGYGREQVDGKKVLERMCGETGGRVFEVSKKLTVDAIYKQIAEELRTQYRLGFTPSAESAAEGYHQISLGLTGELVKSKDVVQTRDGYYAGAAK